MPTSIAPPPARRQMLAEPSLGAGNFLQHALAHNPNPDLPFLYAHRTDEQGRVLLDGHSLLDLAAIRDAYARWYFAHGVRPGQPVGVYVREGLEAFLHYLGLTALGAIPAMMNDNMPLETAKRYLAHVGAVGLVTDQPAALLARYGPDDPRPGFTVTPDDLRDAPAGELPDRYPYQHTPEETVALVHSSGTTGMPKATIVGHQQFWVGRRSRVLNFPSAPEDRLLSALPHTHAAGISYLLNATLIGLPTVAASDWRREAVESLMTVFQPSVVVGFPRTYVELATGRPPAAAAARVHTWISTGDRAHYAHVRRLVRLGRRPGGDGKSALAGSVFIDGLGSSELGMSLFQFATTPESARDDCCIGRPVEIVEKAAVLDPDGRELPDGVPGLLGVRTPTRTPGYWNAPELTTRHELGGYWLSGDVVRRSADGAFYHLDREVDVIHTAEGPVHSLPLEEVLLADRADLVLDCAVVAVPAPDGAGHAPVAVVVLQEGAAPEDLLAELNSALDTAGLTPLTAALVAGKDADFPLGATGKVLKRELRTELADLLTGAAPSL